MTKLSKAEAAQIFYNAAKRDGITLLGEYTTALMPVKGLCPQGHEVSPAPNAIKKGQGWCKNCAAKKKNAAKLSKHRAAFLARAGIDGVTILGPYVDWHTPILCRCSKGHLCNPRPADIMSKGTGWCAGCAWNEFRILYLVVGEFEGKWWAKIGRASREIRLKDHLRNGWQSYARWDVGHDDVVRVESAIKQKLRAMKASNLPKQLMPQDGHTETFPIEHLAEIRFAVEAMIGGGAL